MNDAKLVTFLILILLIGGCSINKHYSDDQYQEAEKMAIQHLQDNYQNTEDIIIESVDDSPMGGIFVAGTMDGAIFNASLNVSNDGKMYFGSLGTGEGFPELKPECVEKFC